MRSCTRCSGRLDHCGPFQPDPCYNWDSLRALALLCGAEVGSFPSVQALRFRAAPVPREASRHPALLGSEALVPRNLWGIGGSALSGAVCICASCWFRCPREQGLACLPYVSRNFWGEQLGKKVRTPSPARCADWHMHFLKDEWYLTHVGAFCRVGSDVLQVMHFSFPGDKPLNICVYVYTHTQAHTYTYIYTFVHHNYI